MTSKSFCARYRVFEIPPRSGSWLGAGWQQEWLLPHSCMQVFKLASAGAYISDATAAAAAGQKRG